jgi:hypothetical protein
MGEGASMYVGGACACLAFLMTLAVAIYMSWYINNVNISSGLNQISFLTQIKDDWSVMGYIDLKLVGPEGGRDYRVECPSSHPEDTVFYDVWPGTTTYCDCSM